MKFLPNKMHDTLILIEDRKFYSHFGIDFWSILRAVFTNVRERKYVQGGSTITQQLARTKYLSNEKSLFRKIKEAFIAIWLEIVLNKHAILLEYSSLVYMGQTKFGKSIYGFRDAARIYFKKTLKELTIPEQAMLIGMLKGPNLFRPGSYKGKVRQVLVLSVMAKNGIINSKEFSDSLKSI